MSDGNDGAERWIVVRNWERFQHYKDRDPPWIKNYTRLMSDDNYLRLSGNRRAILHGLWMTYALSSTCLRLDLKLIRGRLALEVKMADLEALNRAGFLEFTLAPLTASNPLAPRARSQETELPKENPQPQTEARTPLIDREARPEANGDLSKIGWDLLDYRAALSVASREEEDST